MNKTEKAIHVFTSSNTVFSKSRDYKEHISLLCEKTGWVKATEVKEKGSVSRRPTRSHSQPDDDGGFQADNVGLWQSECHVLRVKGPQCGPVMCSMFRKKINEMLSDRQDSALAKSFNIQEEQLSADSRSRTLHHMSFLLIKMRRELLIVEESTSTELGLSWALFGLSWWMFKERVGSKNIFNVEEKPAVALPFCNIRQHLKCFRLELEDRGG
jgi:hypothetical protein